MATDTLSTIYSSVYLGLGQPTDEILARNELCNIVCRRLSYRLEQVRQSEQGISITKTAEFTLDSDSNQEDLTALVSDLVVPMWCEAQVSQVLGNDVWAFIPTVNISMLQAQRARLLPSVAFHGENSREVLATFSFYGNEMFMNAPYNNLRVWYLPTFSLPDTEQETIDLPQNLVNILVYDSYISAIPLMLANAAKNVDRDPTLLPQMKAWEGLMMQYREERTEFQFLWEKWCKESRGAHRPRRRGDVLPKVMGRQTFPWAINNNS